jgi:hypothetical protein
LNFSFFLQIFSYDSLSFLPSPLLFIPLIFLHVFLHLLLLHLFLFFFFLSTYFLLLFFTFSCVLAREPRSCLF